MGVFEAAEAATDFETGQRPADSRSEPEVEYDEISRLASSVCRTPLSMVMLLDGQGQWYKASGALRTQEPAVSAVFCDWALSQTEILVVCDTGKDARFRSHPQVTGAQKIRFFAGAPILTREHHVIGVLCTVDVVPRVLTSEQEEGMELLAKQLQARMELREQRQELEQLVADKERAAASLAASEELFRAFMNASPFLSYIKNAAGRLVFYNRAFAQRFGVSDEAWLGRSDDQLWGREMSAAMRGHDMDVMSGRRMVESEERLHGPEGAISCWKTYKFPCHDSTGNVLLAGVAVDMTDEIARKAELERYQHDLEQVNDQLRRLSVTDELTGLRNRRAFEERLALEFSVARRRQRPVSVLLIDVDFFKQINDRWGHAAGDTVLRSLGAVLRTTVRLPDLVARYGGEEFAVLLPESGTEAALGLATRLMERIAAEHWEHDPVTVSIGVATLKETTSTGYELVEQADEALYAAKRSGRNRAVVHGSETP